MFKKSYVIRIRVNMKRRKEMFDLLLNNNVLRVDGCKEIF